MPHKVEVVLTPEVIQRSVQFVYDIIGVLEQGGFHIRDMDDAVLCVQELCYTTNLIELGQVDYEAEEERN
jgi:hypothetical protein